MIRTFPFLNRIRASLRPLQRPPVAVEIAPGEVLAAAKVSASDVKYAFRALPEGAVQASASQPNLRSIDAVITAVRSAVQEVCGAMHSVSLLIPDPATRVFALEFDSLPESHTDVLAVLRLRLKRVVPFDVDTAKISYQVLVHNGHARKVLIVIVPGNVLNEYEAAVQEAGYQPGAVLPSALAALAALDTDVPALSAYLSGKSLTTSITTLNNILLYRTHELSEDHSQRIAEIQRDIAVAVAYFEDELHISPTCVHYAGNVNAEEFGQSVVGRHIPVRDFSPATPGGDFGLPVHTNPAGLIGALAGARFA